MVVRINDRAPASAGPACRCHPAGRADCWQFPIPTAIRVRLPVLGNAEPGAGSSAWRWRRPQTRGCRSARRFGADREPSRRRPVPPRGRGRRCRATQSAGRRRSITPATPSAAPARDGDGGPVRPTITLGPHCGDFSRFEFAETCSAPVLGLGAAHRARYATAAIDSFRVAHRTVHVRRRRRGDCAGPRRRRGCNRCAHRGRNQGAELAC